MLGDFRFDYGRSSEREVGDSRKICGLPYSLRTKPG